jgi:hypothetical protein
MEYRTMDFMKFFRSMKCLFSTSGWTFSSRIHDRNNWGLSKDHPYIIDTMNRIPAIFLIVLMSIPVFEQVPAMAASDLTDSQTPSVPKATPTHAPKTSGVIAVHKPQIDPAWGKVVQYHREQVGGASDKNRETLHEFLFQDDQGVIRTAIFHENVSGNGYWEVWVWDQP